MMYQVVMYESTVTADKEAKEFAIRGDNIFVVFVEKQNEEIKNTEIVSCKKVDYK